MRRYIIYSIILALVITTAIGCGKRQGRERRLDKKKDEIVPVKIMNVRSEGLNEILEYVGNIKGSDEAIVYPKVSGKIVEKVKEEGSAVTKGEAIVFIDRDEVGLQYEKAPVESPLAGVVGRVYVDIGSTVTPQTQVALVTSTDRVEIDLDIPEKYLPRISLGQEAEIKIDAYPDNKFMGKVTMISPVVDLQTRTAPIEITIDNSDRRLQSGMFARVSLIIEKNKRTPVVLKEAIIGKEPDTYVYVIENNKAYLKKVVLGAHQGPYVEIREGVKEGDAVVIMGQQKLQDGTQVTTEE